MHHFKDTRTKNRLLRTTILKTLFKKSACGYLGHSVGQWPSILGTVDLPRISAVVFAAPVEISWDLPGSTIYSLWGTREHVFFPNYFFKEIIEILREKNYKMAGAIYMEPRLVEWIKHYFSPTTISPGEPAHPIASRIGTPTCFRILTHTHIHTYHMNTNLKTRSGHTLVTHTKPIEICLIGIWKIK